MRIVIDNSVLISAIFWRGNEYRVFRGVLEGRYIGLISVDIIAELKNKLNNKFKFDRTDDLIRIIKKNFDIVDIKTSLDIVRDKNDNMIVECAVDGYADYIITSDRDLLVLKKYRKIKIINSKNFLSQI